MLFPGDQQTRLLFTFCLTLHYVYSANILLAVMDQGRSHAQSFTPLMHRLQSQNHSVTLTMASYVPEIPFGLHEAYFNVSELQNPLDDPEFSSMMWVSDFNFITQIVPFYQGAKSCEYIIKNRKEQFEEIAKGEWDLILTDSLFSTCGYGIASINKAFHVMMHSSDVENAHGSLKSFHRNYGLLPKNFMSPTKASFNPTIFFDRVSSTFDWFGTFLGTAFVSSFFMSQTLKDVVPGFTFKEYYRTSSFSLTDMPESLYPAAPRSNEYFSYGSYCRPPHELSEDWKSFVEDGSSKGTIIIAFGTIVNWSAAPKEYMESFALNDLSDYRIIWSFRGDHPPVKSHVRIGSWIPQNDILLHSKTVLFISHGGLKSVKEAACAGVPSVFMPMFAEQTRNGWLAKNKGFAEVLNKYRLTEKDYIENSIKNILNNPSYRNAGSVLKSEFLDSPLQTLDHGVFIINRLLKYGGRLPEFFYSKALEHSFFTLFNFDLMLLFPIFISIIA